MKNLVKAALCCASVLVMGMALASTASATHWLQCQKGASGTKYLTSACATAGAGEWAWGTIPVGTSETVRLRGTLRLADTKTLVGEAAIECSGEAWGLINSTATGEVTKINKPTCTGRKGCEASGAEAEAIHTPWKVELAETEGKTAEIIKSGTGGEPGWETKCSVLKIKETDTCEQESKKEELLFGLNVNSGGEQLVLVTFAKVHKAKCSKGGAESGKVENSLTVLKLGGVGLALSLH
jgi:hypothetical protein